MHIDRAALPARSRWLRRAAVLVLSLLVCSVNVGLSTPASAAGPARGRTHARVSSGPFHLQFAHSGRCLDDPHYATANGTQLDQWDCVNQTNELWYFDYIDSSNFRIRGASSGKCVNVAGNSFNNDTPVILWTCGDYLNENFVKTYDSSTNTPPGAYWWYSATAATSMVLNISGAVTGNGGKLIMWGRGAYSNEYVRTY
jgi:hypothetical protein